MTHPRTRTPQFLERATHAPTASPATFARVASPHASAPFPLPTAPSVMPLPLPSPTVPHLPMGAGQLRPEPPPPLGSTDPGDSPTRPDFAAISSPADVRPLASAVEALRLEASRLAEQARSDAVEIGFQVARRILELELSTGPAPVFSLVRTAVRRVGDARRLSIRLHPDDAKLVDVPDGRARLGLSVLTLEVVPDPSLSRGDCVVESEAATVDGRLSTRLDELKRGVSAALGEESP